VKTGRNLAGLSPTGAVGISRLIVALAAWAALSPLIHRGSTVENAVPMRDFPGWVAAPIPSGLAPIALDASTERFAADFPGRIGAFAEDDKVWVVRWTVQPTRKLHPASDCLRASGCHVVPGPAWADGHGALWSTSTAGHDGKQWRVRERLVGTHGGSWTDVSTWFWQSLWKRATGPWWAVTVFEPAQ
jgi:hypothetical protein